MSISNNPPLVAVVIVNYRRLRDTLECLQSVMDSTGVRLEVIVVDNGSGDDSAEQIRSIYPEISLVALSENKGFASGYNTGIEWALAGSAEDIFLLNNDTTLDPGTMRALVDADWDVGVPKILYSSQPEMIWAAGCRWRRLPPSVAMTGLGKRDGPAYDQPGPLEFATGCALMVKRRVLETTTGFDQDLQNYMEDYDFCYRLRQAGFSIGFVPAAKVWHKVSQTLGEYSPERWQQQGKNTVLFYRKGNRFSQWALWLFLVWVSLRELVKGHLRILPGFWSGIRQGFRKLRDIQIQGSAD